MKAKTIYLLLIVFCLFGSLSAQKSDPDSSVNLNRKKALLIANSSIYIGSYTGLYYLWYKNYKSSSFHFFNDAQEWMQVDKIGHIYSAYYLTKYQVDAFKWSGMSKEKAILTGSIMSFIGISTIEVMDGFSSKWGASIPDILANSIGIGLYAVQKTLFNNEYFIPKYSYNSKSYIDLRPELFGSYYAERLFKDYNGQTYWLSFNIKDITSIKGVPAYLNLALGYGAKNILGGNENPTEFTNYNRQRQYYLALDLNLKKINTNKKWLKATFYLLNMFKVPLPTIEYSAGKFKFYPIYF